MEYGKWDQDDRLGKHWALSPSYININILFENDLKTSRVGVLTTKVAEEQTHRLAGEKQFTLPHSWQMTQKRGKISQSWASPLRSKEFRYQVGQPAVKSGTGKMGVLLPKSKREAYWMAIGNKDSSLLECAQISLLLFQTQKQKIESPGALA